MTGTPTLGDRFQAIRNHLASIGDAVETDEQHDALMSVKIALNDLAVSFEG